ncbi:MAG: hypothetical protein U0R80_12305 [Nocardioidaceae bacterium]
MTENDSWLDEAPDADESASQRRVVAKMSTGGKLSVVAALLLLVFMVFLMLSPVSRTDASNKAVDCGTVVSPPPTDFVRGLCGQANDMRLAQTIAVGAAAVIVGVGGVMTFGIGRRDNQAVGESDGDD